MHSQGQETDKRAAQQGLLAAVYFREDAALLGRLVTAAFKSVLLCMTKPRFAFKPVLTRLNGVFCCSWPSNACSYTELVRPNTQLLPNS